MGHISKSSSKLQIEEAFGEFGPVKSVDVSAVQCVMRCLLCVVACCSQGVCLCCHGG